MQLLLYKGGISRHVHNDRFQHRWLDRLGIVLLNLPCQGCTL